MKANFGRIPSILRCEGQTWVNQTLIFKVNMGQNIDFKLCEPRNLSHCLNQNLRVFSLKTRKLKHMISDWF